jgi:hypothetical protein
MVICSVSKTEVSYITYSEVIGKAVIYQAVRLKLSYVCRVYICTEKSVEGGVSLNLSKSKNLGQF